MKDAQQIMERTNQRAAEGAASMFKGLPREPLEGAVYDGFVEALSQAVSKLSGGQVPLQVQPSAGAAVREFPDDVGLPLAAVKTVLDQLPEGQPYRFGSVDLETEQGIIDVTARLMRAADDRALVAKSTTPAPAKQAPPPVAPKARVKSKAEDLVGDQKFSDQHSTMTNI